MKVVKYLLVVLVSTISMNAQADVYKVSNPKTYQDLGYHYKFPCLKISFKSKYTRAEIIKALHNASYETNLPIRMLVAIATIESSLTANKIHRHDGDGDSYGLLQIKLETAREMGFTGEPKLLLVPSINSYYAAKYLKHKVDHYQGDWVAAIAAYNRGHTEFHISNEDYVSKVLAQMVKL